MFGEEYHVRFCFSLFFALPARPCAVILGSPSTLHWKVPGILDILSVSVILPVYNAAKTLPAALESLFAQTITNFEIIAVDDGSTDDSPAILRAAAAEDPRLCPLYLDRLGLVNALQQGLAACRGEYVARMDADDLCHPDRLKQQLEYLRAHTEISVVGCLVEILSLEAEREGFARYAEWLNSLIDPQTIRRDIFVESPLAHPSIMLRREELLALGGYADNGWPEDYDLWLRYFSAGKQFAKVPQTLLQWRDDGERLTRTDSRYSVENFLRAKAHYLLHGPLRDRDAMFIWGAGQMGRRISKHLTRGGAPLVAFLDIDPKKIGGTLRGLPVQAADELPNMFHAHRHPIVLAAVSSHGARPLIRARLDDWGLIEMEDYWCVA